MFIILLVGLTIVALTAIIIMTSKTGSSDGAFPVNEQSTIITKEEQASDSTTKKVNIETAPTLKESFQERQLLKKAEQVETFRMVFSILLILSSVIYLGLTIAYLRDEICFLVSMTIIIAAILNIYLLNIWTTTKQELCKGQAEILKLLHSANKEK